MMAANACAAKYVSACHDTSLSCIGPHQVKLRPCNAICLEDYSSPQVALSSPKQESYENETLKPFKIPNKSFEDSIDKYRDDISDGTAFSLLFP